MNTIEQAEELLRNGYGPEDYRQIALVLRSLTDELKESKAEVERLQKERDTMYQLVIKTASTEALRKKLGEKYGLKDRVPEDTPHD